MTTFWPLSRKTSYIFKIFPPIYLFMPYLSLHILYLKMYLPSPTLHHTGFNMSTISSEINQNKSLHLYLSSQFHISQGSHRSKGRHKVQQPRHRPAHQTQPHNDEGVLHPPSPPAPREDNLSSLPPERPHTQPAL